MHKLDVAQSPTHFSVGLSSSPTTPFPCLLSVNSNETGTLSDPLIDNGACLQKAIFNYRSSLERRAPLLAPGTVLCALGTGAVKF